MKFKNIIYLDLLVGLSLSLILHSAILNSCQFKINKEDFDIDRSGLSDSRVIFIDYFGLGMVNDFNNCIYVMASENYSSGLGGGYYGDIILIKYSQSGVLLWKIALEGLIAEYSKIAVDSKSNLYLTSMYKVHVIGEDMVLFKFNSSGDLQWQRIVGGGSHGGIADIAIDSADNVYIYGTSDLQEWFKFDLFLVKYNSYGDQQWFRIYEELSEEYWAEGIEIDSNNNVIITGGTYWYENETDHRYSWLRSYNQSGGLNWHVTREKGYFWTLNIDSSDRVITGTGSSIEKYDKLGNLLWKWDPQINFYSQLRIAFDSFNNVYIATCISIPEDHHTYDIYLIKINSSGSFEWYLTWGGPDYEDCKAIAIDSYDNLYLLSDRFLVKNPENNHKPLTNIKLWVFYLILFGICFFISIISLYLIIKRKIPKT